MITIGIDLMGAELDPLKLFYSIFQNFENFDKDVSLELFVTIELKSEISRFLVEKKSKKIQVNYSKYFISMEDTPLRAFRKKHDSTMLQALKFLKDKKIDALITCGNTGVLVTSTKIIVKTLKKIKRPALLALVPTKKNNIAFLDVGANISHKSKDLVDFASLGAAFQRVISRKDIKVGLLNIGSEKQKGTAEIRKTFNSLSKKKTFFNFVGNIEAKEVFEGKVDVLVTDGFTGNIFLKTSEGITSFIIDKIYKKALDNSFDLMNELKNSLYYENYPGAILIGARELIIKCHSYSTIESVISAIKGSVEFVKKDLIVSIKKILYK